MGRVPSQACVALFSCGTSILWLACLAFELADKVLWSVMISNTCVSFDWTNYCNKKKEQGSVRGSELPAMMA